MPRSSHAVFLNDDPEPEKKKSYCRFCEEKYSKLNKLVPRILEDGTIDDKFKRCTYCGELTPIYDVKWESEYEPKGYLQTDPYNPFNQSGVRVAVKSNKRITKANKVEAIEPVEVPKLAGKADTELENMLSGKDRPAILNYLNDVVVENSDSENY